MQHNVRHRWTKNISWEDPSEEWTTYHISELIIRMGDLNARVGWNFDGFQGVLGGFNIGKKNL